MTVFTNRTCKLWPRYVRDGLLACIMLVMNSSSAYASGIGDLINFLPPVMLMRSLVKNAIAKPAAEGFREEAEKLIDNKINPMLDRVDYIIHHNITDAADEAMVLLKQCEKSMTAIIQEASKAGNSLISNFFSNLNESLGHAISEFDAKLNEALRKISCIVAPEGRGIIISASGLPMYDEVRVWFPARSKCWAQYLTSTERPLYRVFDGWQAYRGKICEQEYAINDIHPDDPKAMLRLAEVYSQLYILASRAHCAEKTNADQEQLISWQAEWDRKVRIYRQLASN